MRTILFVFVFGISVGQLASQSVNAPQKHFNTKNNIAIEGFDPVSYFDGKPQEGKPEWKLPHKGVVQLFSSPANLNRFKTSPDSYEPAYGGWCAYAMGTTGEKVKIDPGTYKILEGKVYLFYNFWGNNTLTNWKKDEKKLKAAADQNWNKLVQ